MYVYEDMHIDKTDISPYCCKYKKIKRNMLPCPFYISILSQQIYIDTPNVNTFGIVAEQTLEHGPPPLCLAKSEFKLPKAVDELHI